MKKGKWAVLSVIAAAMCPIAVACSDNTKPEHEHTYEGQQWVITTMPTETTGGVASRDCVDNDHTDTKQLPNLKDTSFWTVDDDKSSPAGHGTPGKTVYTSEYGDVEVPISAEEHTYGSWDITLDPTWDETGSATRVCTEDQHPDTVTVEKLSDTSVWTKDTEHSVEAGCTTGGKDVYKSKYGTVEIVIPAPGHSPTGGWTVTQEPTATTGGKSTSACANCDDTIEKDLPSFEDTEFWTHTHAVADYNHGTQDTYSSDFGIVVKEANDKYVAPYDNKTYFGICFDTEKAGGNPIDSYGATMSITLDAKGAAESGNFLFGGSGYTFHIRMDDFAKGLITLENTKGEEHSEQAAYLDTESGIFVRIENKYVWAFTPFETDTEGAPYKTTKASHWTVDNKTAIVATYTSPASNDSKAYNIFVYGNKAYFGVKFASDKAGTSSLAAEACYNAQHVYVFDKDDEMIAAFAYDGEKMVETDGLEGAYTGTLDGASVTLNVSGHGAFTGDNAGTYTVAADGSSYTLDAYIDGKYFEITLTGNEFTAVKPMVKVILESDYDTETVGDPEKSVNKNIVMTLPELSDEAQHFGGWFFDAACTQPVPAQFKPTENVTLHAKWAQKVDITLHIDADDSSTIYLGVGDVIGTKLPELGVDVANNRYFVGWYTDAGCTTPLRTNAAVTAAQSGSTVYAKWETLPAYYGEYHGYQLLSGTTEKTIELSIDEHGDIEGSYIGSSGSSAVTIAGRVTAFDKELGVITWQRTGFDGVYRMWVDDGVVLIAVPENTQSSTELGTYPYMLTKGSTSSITGSTNIGFHNGASTTQWYTYLVSYGTANKLAFVYNSKIYADVTVADAFGTNIATIDAVNASKTIVVKDSNGSVIVKFGTTADKMTDTKDTIGGDAVRKPIDDYAGKYTIGGTEYSLNGIGDIVWNGLGEGVTATYSFVKEEGDFFVFDVFTRTIKLTPVSGGSSSGDYGDGEYSDYEDDDDVTYNKEYVNKEYFVLKIAKPETSGTSSFEKIMKELKYNVNLPADAENTTVAAETESKNAKIEFVLSKEYDIDAVGNYVFAGWYDNAACTGDELTKLTITDDKEVFAKWVEKLTVTLHINFEGENELAPVYVGNGFVAEIDEPTIEGVSFIGWFTDAECTHAWDPTATVTADMDLYAKWGTPAYMGTFYLYGVYANGSFSSSWCSGHSFNAKGVYLKDGGYPFSSSTAKIECTDEEHGLISLATDGNMGNGTHAGFIDTTRGDKSTNTMVVNWDIVDNNLDLTRFFIFAPQQISGAKNSVWNNGSTHAITYTMSDGAHSVFVHKNCVYFDVTFKMADGTDVSGDACNTSPTLYVRSSDGTLIAKFGYDGTAMNELDGYEDITYAGSLGNVSVDGVKVVTVGDKTGSYSLASDADYTADVYVDGSYYEITFDKAAATYTAVKRMVTLNYVTDYDVAHAVSGQVNKNIGVALPVLTDATHIFRGWFIDEQGTLPVAVVEGKFVPTETTTTLYAKWDDKVTLTVVYNTVTHDGITDMQNATKEYGAGDELNLDEFVPPYINGKAFDGWYTDNACTAAFTGTTITADTMVYAKWIDAVAMLGEYQGWNFCGNNAETKTLDRTATVSALGAIYASYGQSNSNDTSKNAKVSDYDAQTGTFKLLYADQSYSHGYYDAKYGILAWNYYNREASKISFENDMMLFFRKGTVVNVDTSTHFGSDNTNKNIMGGRLLTVHLTGGEIVNLYINDKKVYSDVTWIAANADGNVQEYTAKTVKDASSITVFDSNGDIIIKRAKSGSYWKDLDDYAGTYSGSLGTLTFNGVGVVKLNGVSSAGTYTLVADTADYTADVYVDGKYYQVTIDKTGESYTAVKPEATITFSSAHSTHANVQANVNINYTLPTVDPVEVGDFKFKGWYDNEEFTGSPITTFKPTSTEAVTIYARWIDKVDIVYEMNGHGSVDNAKAFPEQSFSLPTASTVTADGWVFKGWYDNAGFTGSAKTTITPVAGQNVTMYAKWVNEVTLTVVYATESDNADIFSMENSTKTYGAGDSVSLTTPAVTGGMAFDYWYTIVDGVETKYTEGAIENNLTVYCKWKEAHIATGTYRGVEIYGSTNNDKVVTSSSTTVTIDANGKQSGGRGNGNTLAEIDNKPNAYKAGSYYTYFDENEGILLQGWSAGNGIGTDFYFLCKKEYASYAISANLTTSGWTCVITVTYKDNSTVNVLVYNDKAYSGVTWNEGVSALDTKNASELIVKDASGKTIVTIANKVATAGEAA